MKIDRIEIDGYKSLVGFKYELDNFNVIIGNNNAGKSNFLEVFSLLNKIIFGSEREKSLIYGGISDRGNIITNCEKIFKDEMKLLIEYTDNWNEEEFKYIYELTLKFDIMTAINKKSAENEGAGILYEKFQYKNVRKPGPLKELFFRDNQTVQFNEKVSNKLKNIDCFETVISIINKLPDIKNALDEEVLIGITDIGLICRTQVLYSNSDEIRKKVKSIDMESDNVSIENGRIISMNIKQDINKILKSDQKEIYKQILLQVLDIKNIIPSIIGNKGINPVIIGLKVEFSNGHKISINQVSDGMLIVINLITYLVSNNYPIIAIEELENSIHPQLLQKLITLIYNNFTDKQIIITTHSPALINMVKKEHVSIIRQNENGISEIQNIKNNKELMKEIAGPFSELSDIFYIGD